MIPKKSPASPPVHGKRLVIESVGMIDAREKFLLVAWRARIKERIAERGALEGDLNRITELDVWATTRSGAADLSFARPGICAHGRRSRLSRLAVNAA